MKPAETAEGRRLAENDRRRGALEPLGAVPLRARLGHGARGLQRGRDGLGLFPPRPRALARLPLERGRDPGGISDRHQHDLLRARALEREGPDPQGAPLRPDELRGQPRRGRQGVLVLPRLDADALVHEVPLQVSAGRVPVPAAPRGEPAPRRSSEPEYELIDTGIFDGGRYFDVFVEYAKASPEDILVEITVDNRGPGGGDARPAADDLVPQHVVLGPDRTRPASPPRTRAGGRRPSLEEADVRAALPPRAPRTPSCSSPRTRPTPSASSARPTPRPTSRTPSTRTSIGGRRDAVNPDRRGTKAAARHAPRRFPPAAKPGAFACG